MASTPIKPSFNAEDIPAFTVGEYKSVDLQPSGGTPPYRCDVTQGDLPAGLDFGKEGTLSGTAKTPNDTAPPTVWFRVTDAYGLQGTRAFTVTVLPRT